MTNEEKIKQNIMSLAKKVGAKAEEVAELSKLLNELISKRAIRDINFNTRAGRSDAVDYMLELSDCMEDENISDYDKALSFLGAILSAGSLYNIYGKSQNKSIVTQKLLKSDWVPKCIQGFQEVMPPINKPYPKIYYATERTLEQRLYEASVKIHSRIEFPVDSSMYYSHGEIGDAILIYMENLQDDDYTAFAQKFWSYLGNFYVINSWPEDWFWDYEFDHALSSPESYGYNIWITFFGVTISNLVYQKSIEDVEDIEEKDLFEERTEKWRRWLLKDTFMGNNINFSSLASYLASVCSENSVANDCILTAPNFAQPFLLEMKSLFKKTNAAASFLGYKQADAFRCRETRYEIGICIYTHNNYANHQYKR